MSPAEKIAEIRNSLQCSLASLRMGEFDAKGGEGFGLTAYGCHCEADRIYDVIRVLESMNAAPAIQEAVPRYRDHARDAVLLTNKEE